MLVREACWPSFARVLPALAPELVPKCSVFVLPARAAPGVHTMGVGVVDAPAAPGAARTRAFTGVSEHPARAADFAVGRDGGLGGPGSGRGRVLAESPSGAGTAAKSADSSHTPEAAVSIRHPLIASIFALAGLMSCGPSGASSAGAGVPVGELASAQPAHPAAAPACAPFTETTGPLPEVKPEHLTLEFWLEQLKRDHDPDEVLLTPAEATTLDASLAVPREDYHAPRDLLAPFDPAKLTTEVAERLAWAREKLGSGEYVTPSGAKLAPADLSSLEASISLAEVQPELRVAVTDVQIRCAPLARGFFSPSLDLRLDRNACSALRSQEVVRVVAPWPSGMLLVDGKYSFGWLENAAALSPPLPQSLRQAFVRGDRVQLEAELELTPEGLVLAPGTTLPLADKRQRRAHVATASGFVTTSKAHAKLLRPTQRVLTRRAFLEEAWRFIGTPYGLGDTGGGRDCSRLVRDVFESFDVHLPRHSSWQSKAGTFWIDVADVAEANRPLLFDAAARKGVVLLHFPGHIMVYLGRNERGTPMVLHALGEYVEPCAAGAGETLVRVKNITVSDLELGRGTSRKSLLERVTRVTVIGKSPGIELAGIAQMRPVADARIPAERHCQDSERAAIYVMPEVPNQKQPLRVVSVVDDDPGPAALTLIDPDGRRLAPSSVQLGGPPFGHVATVDHPKRGRWRAVLADGDRVISCQTFNVRASRPRPNEPDGGPIWDPKYKWNPANENLYSIFVERLFDYDLRQERVWTDLHSLLRDPERNILFDYRGLDEDAEIELVPDCADLPYTLRAYFAWKMRLPFGYKRCTRGRAGKPPRCDEPGAGDNLMSRLELPGKGGLLTPRGDVEAFELFVKAMRSAVHSSSGRTLPNDELSDFYPVALTRQALKPGTVFADPYGHFLVLSDWVPQGTDGYGMLVGVDAQPDGTIGQRRFWRGTFVFDPETSSGGAGFKAFRPRTFKEEPVVVELDPADLPASMAGPMTAPPMPPPTAVSPDAVAAGPVMDVEGAFAPAITPVTVERIGYYEDVDNAELTRSRRYNRLNLGQYRGSADDFYSAVEALINPRPLEPQVMLRALLDALREQVMRRVISVDMGEKWAREHPGEIIEMPEGDAIFLAAGPWEDFSTPSRDLRLLIALDTVLGFPKSVRAAPERFGIRAEDAADLGRRLAELSSLLDSELSKQVFSYTRSDGSTQRLSLAELARRASGLEMAYNPNDCVEIRWAAPAGSPELGTCVRRAPAEQRQNMERYRPWFATRKRPPQ